MRALAVAIPACSASSPAHAPLENQARDLAPGSVVGKVIDVHTLQPIQGLNVYVVSISYRKGNYAMTNDDGLYRFTGVRAGRHTIRLQYGDQMFDRPVTVEPGQAARLDWSIDKSYGVTDPVRLPRPPPP